MFSSDLDRMRRRLKTVGSRTIDPQGRFVQWWDTLTFSALVYTAVGTPFEVALFEDGGLSKAELAVMFALNRSIDAIFLVDVFVNFYLPYRESAKKGGRLVYDNARIVRHVSRAILHLAGYGMSPHPLPCLLVVLTHEAQSSCLRVCWWQYLRGYFFIDLFTCIPMDVILDAIASSADVELDGQLFKLLRMLKLLKLVRMVRGMRIVSRWQDYIGVSFAVLALVKFAIMTIVLAHWLACLWAFVSLGGNADAEWTGYDHASEEGITWRQKHGVGARTGDTHSFAIYGVALYVSLNNIFGGSCEINPANYAEFYVQSLMLLMGSSMFAYIIGSVCGIIATLDPALIEFRQQMDELNLFVRDQGLSDELRVKLRAYFRNTIHYIRTKRYGSLLEQMSSQLRGHTAYEMCRTRMRKVPYLNHDEIEPEYMCELAVRYVTKVYSQMERLPCHNLAIVDRGMAVKNGRFYLGGSCLALDFILANEALRDLDDAIALTFVQVITLTRADVVGLLPKYPKAEHIVRRAALQMAVNRTVIKVAQIIRRKGVVVEHVRAKGSSQTTQLFDDALREMADAKQFELDRKKPGNAGALPLTLKQSSLDEQQQLLLMRKLREKWQRGGSFASMKVTQPSSMKWGKLVRQKTHFLNAERASDRASFKQKTGGRSPGGTSHAVLRHIGIQDGLPGFVQPASQLHLHNGGGTDQAHLLSDAMARNHAAVMESTAQLLEAHKKALERIEKLEQANAAVMSKLEEIATRSRGHRHRSRLAPSWEASEVAILSDAGERKATVQSKLDEVSTRRGHRHRSSRSSPPFRPSRQPTESGLVEDYREDIRKEGVQPAVRSSPFEA